MRTLGLVAALSLVHATAAALPPAEIPDEPAPSIGDPPTPYELALAGDAWRLETRRGPVHVWVPNGYDPETAATVVYVHGYYVDVDRAWVEHRLPEQFAASHLNALFIACEAPSRPGRAVVWPSLSSLLDTVARDVPVERPRGRTVAIAHSGAYRTVDAWLDERRLDTIALVDAAYGELSHYRTWLRGGEHRRLIDVGSDTRPSTDRFHRAWPATRVVDGFPPPESGTLPELARQARVLYIRASRGHMELVTDGVALPMVLRALRVPLVGASSRTAPLQPFGANCDHSS